MYACYCSDCGSVNVEFKALSSWCQNKNDWVFYDDDNGGNRCNDCGGIDVGIEWGDPCEGKGIEKNLDETKWTDKIIEKQRG